MIKYLTKLLFKPKIPVICLRQPITQGVYHTINRQLNHLCNIKAIAIVIDSQKGQPVQTELLANRIKKLGREQQVPIYSFVETKCTGQPYLFVGIADKSYCLESSIVGMHRNWNWFGITELLRRNKIEQRSYVSNPNSVQRMLLPFSDANKGQLTARIHEIQKTIADTAIENLGSKNKHHKLSIQNFNQAQWSIGKQAVEKGFIGEIGNVYSVLQMQFPGIDLKLIEHSTILKQYLKMALALPFVGIVLLLGLKSFLKYFTLFLIYIFVKKNKNHKKDKKEKQAIKS